MKCSVCGTQNPPDARFCRRCSAALPREAQVEVTDPAQAGETITAPLADSLGTRPFDARLGTRPLGEDGPAQSTATPASDAQATQPLPRPRFFFESLPIGALVGGLPYEIQSILSANGAVNVYAAQDRHQRIRCRTCAFARNAYGDEYCQQCSAPLNGIEPHHPRYVVKESIAADAIAIERRLADLRLHHGGALLPADTFSETIASTRRYYVVLPEPSPTTGASLTAPQELLDVLSWGVMLAESLAFLHQHNIAFGAADLAHVSLDNKMARWFDFTSARIVQPGVEARGLLKEDVTRLAASLFVLLTGQMYSPRVVLEPPSLALTFADVSTGKLMTALGLADRLRGALAEVRRPASYDVRVGRLTDVGQMRQLNEDSLLTLEAGQVYRSVSRPFGLYIVADGAGGHAAGDVASGIAVRAIARQAIDRLFVKQFDESPSSVDVAGWLRSAIQTANEAVHRQRSVTRTDMGTVIVMAVLLDAEAHIAHVGDSRAYRLNESGIQQLTTDHSLVQRLIDTGQITAAEARTHENRNVIYKMIGDRPKVEPDLNKVSLAPGDRLLLCSDGLSGYVDDADIHDIVMSAASPQEACQRLIDAANQTGGPDNITAILVQIDALGQSED
ncbi:MAG: Stp1/IreP family PP2C-type Ser/Thr phosphatase [Anaerolineae bacterium]